MLCACLLTELSREGAGWIKTAQSCETVTCLASLFKTEKTPQLLFLAPLPILSHLLVNHKTKLWMLLQALLRHPIEEPD